MSESADQELGPRLDAVLDVIMDIANGDVEARCEQSDRGDILDALACGVNILAEEIGKRLDTITRLGDELAAEKEQVIAVQGDTIRKLSSPAIRLLPGVVVIPLIGAIDTARAQDIIETLLDSIVQMRARVAILDITGVADMDSKVGEHLLRAVRTSRMLGTQVIVCGISPANALALLETNVELEDVLVAGSLEQGLHAALAATGRRIVDA
ncbi:putative positive regulator [Plesiocystis pacifica SIR-1]|uniref:Putative positive regulator n=1 Tax=Plesiocystis pacifica SIR-1 TaxID=391625 RepID=A6GCC6_9BACT|nr:STAS domain-containing protein [Plesiocystis pacifica]EDM76485.1 putative positive regulator [Plesiocystis pacifica SIR-1]